MKRKQVSVYEESDGNAIHLVDTGRLNRPRGKLISLADVVSDGQGLRATKAPARPRPKAPSKPRRKR